MLYFINTCKKILENVEVYITFQTLKKYLQADLIKTSSKNGTYHILKERFHEYMLFFLRNDYRNYYLLKYMTLNQVNNFLKEYVNIFNVINTNVTYFLDNYKMYYIKIGRQIFIKRKDINLIEDNKLTTANL
jgi:hypothetical protein